MRIEDKPEFSKILAATMDVYGRQITTAFVEIFFSAMNPYDLSVVREALSRHIQDPEGGRFAPKPADLIRQITIGKSHDGRPGRDEAWAIAQNAFDESKTVIVTEDILGAMEIARPLLLMRDKIAARMAFIESYDRLVGERRATGATMEWQVSLGTDKNQRINAIENAKARGLLAPERANLLIASQREEPISSGGLAIAGLLQGKKASTTEELRAKWKELRSRVAGAVRDDKMDQQRKEIKEAEGELERMRLTRIEDEL